MIKKVKHFLRKKVAAPVFAFAYAAGRRARAIKNIFQKEPPQSFFAALKTKFFPGPDKKRRIEFTRNEVEEAVVKRSFFQSAARMGTQDQVVFAKRLAILIKSGISIITALDILKKQASSGGSRRIIGHLRGCIERGQSLATAMGSYKNIFGHFGISIVLVGETSGTLVQNLHYMADELKKKQELKRAIVSALIYPAFIVVATVGIVIMLTAYVFPKILPIFTSFKAELPWSTKVLIAVSNAMQNYWMYYLAGFVLLAVIWGLLLRVGAIRRANDRMILRMPLLGSMFRSYYIANFTRTFSLLLKSEIGIIQTLRILSDTIGNAAYKEAFEKVSTGVVRGGAVAENMETDKLLFPPLVSQMVSVGEMTGHLGSSLMYLSEMYEDEMNNTTKNLTTSIEPVLMIFMGVLVGFIAMSIITPHLWNHSKSASIENASGDLRCWKCLL
jgi:type II secretory pathway component PulF